MKSNLNKTLVPLAILAACAAGRIDRPLNRAQYVMGTLCEITAHGPNAADGVAAAFSEIQAWDRVLSHFKNESELSAFNRSAGSWFQCSPQFCSALTKALTIAQATGGAFDPTLRANGYRRIEVDERRLRARFLSRDLKVEFGGIGKGIALDYAAKTLRERGVSSAFINFGGQILAIGHPPRAAAWPTLVDATGETLYLSDASISTSGNSERPGHIISPFTGKSVEGSYTAIVAAASAAEADAWSTALFVLGPTASTKYSGCSIFSGPQARRSPACKRYAAPYKGDHS